MKNTEQEQQYLEEKINYILEYVSKDLSSKLSREHIKMLLQFEDDFINMKYEENEKSKPYISFDLRVIEQDEIDQYVYEQALNIGISISLEQVSEILYAALSYMEENDELNEVLNLN